MFSFLQFKESYVSDKPVATGNISGAELIKHIGKNESKKHLQAPVSSELYSECKNNRISLP